MSTPPDRFTRLVQQVEMYAGDMWYQTPCVSSVDTKKLLKAEHRRVVRLVKAKRLVQWKRGRSARQEGYLQACDDLLTALTARGTK